MQARGSVSIKDLEVALGVTATAVREQLAHMMAEGVIGARRVRGDVGRPFYVYNLTAKAQKLADDLTTSLDAMHSTLAAADAAALADLVAAPRPLGAIRRVPLI